MTSSAPTVIDRARPAPTPQPTGPSQRTGRHRRPRRRPVRPGRADSAQPQRHPLVAFALVGAGVAVLGHELLRALVEAGMQPWLANATALVLTLQVNFVLNRWLTWRRHIEGSSIGAFRRWRRFQAARSAGLVLNVAAFPVLAPLVGVTWAYWALFLVSGVMNYLSDRHWSFEGRSTSRRGSAAARAGLGVVAVVAATLLWLDGAIIVLSVLMLVVTTTTLAFQLYKWWTPAHHEDGEPDRPSEPQLPGVVLVPMRHEEAVAEETLDRLANLHHPDYVVMPIVDHPDDPGTAAIAHAAAERYPGRVVVCRYPEDTDVHNKPIGLNAAVQLIDELGIPAEWLGIADAEDLFHPDLLRLVDHRFRTTGAGIVQCGVQLMNFSGAPPAGPRPERLGDRLGQWWRRNASGWWRAANVLEYFKWFQSRLRLQAALGVMPLGGNTVFFRRQVLDDLRRRHGAYWDETCLTEDCKIGISASVIGHDVDVVYDAELVTREETPDTLRALVAQRVRWMQGFIQVFQAGEWRQLPTRRQRVLAVYVLGFQFFQTAAFVLVPVAIALALHHDAPDPVALLSTIPLGLGLISVALDVVLLRHFSRTFGPRARWRDYAGVVLGAYPYQVVLSVAAVRAVVRVVRGQQDWVKTRHSGAHLTARPVPAPVTAQGATAAP